MRSIITVRLNITIHMDESHRSEDGSNFITVTDLDRPGRTICDILDVDNAMNLIGDHIDACAEMRPPDVAP